MKEPLNKSPEFIQDKYIQLLESANVELYKKSKTFSLKNILVYGGIVLGIVLISALILIDNSSDIFENHLVKTNFSIDKVLIQDQKGSYYEVPNQNIKWLTGDGILIEINQNELHFTRIDKTIDSRNYTLYIPENKQFQLFLTDGTKIKVNQKTKISFTNNRKFSKKHVTLQGEAYFEVAHNANAPFKIEASDMQISVLGTEFNLQNYQENNAAQVALINGSVRVGTKNNYKLIVPGEQAIIRNNEQKINISQANFDKILSWTSSQLFFSKKELSKIADIVGEWYGVQIEIPNEAVKKIHFTGNIKKQDGLLHFLQILQYTEHIKYDIHNDTITLTK
jgi:hypothetical protein